MKSKFLHITLCVVLGLAGWEFGTGVYIYAKAQVGQWLIAQAWESSLRTHRPVKPWAWADTFPVGRLVVKKLGVDQYVLSGASGRTLAFGPGHLHGTPLPGHFGNAVIAGHRDTHFSFLRDLRVGDLLEIETDRGQRRRFEVVESTIVHENDPAPLQWSPTAALTLVTCYPFDTPVPGGPLRYVVRAEGRP